MAKIILTSRYLRNASKEKLWNYVRYIGTREGVERIPAENKKNPASVRQKQLVRQIIRDFPDSKKMLEYEDYQKNPTKYDKEGVVNYNIGQIHYQKTTDEMILWIYLKSDSMKIRDSLNVSVSSSDETTTTTSDKTKP